MIENFSLDDVLAVLAKGGVGVIPTDTTYGLVGSAFSEQAVDRIYELKGRDTQKPFIILINSVDDLRKFNIFPDEATKKILSKIWPGKVTVILPCDNVDLFYLHRGGKSLAFRIPDKDDLRAVIRKYGPLVAPSANPQGSLPAASIEMARKYFGDKVDFYQDSGVCQSLPSTIISLSNGTYIVLRSGAGDDLLKKI